jgi:hypothetical protein
LLKGARLGLKAAARGVSWAARGGLVYLDPDASLSAVTHELKHLLDDAARGFPGAEVLYQSKVRWALERAANQAEISLARWMKGATTQAGTAATKAEIDALVTALRRSMTQQWRSIFMPRG